MGEMLASTVAKTLLNSPISEVIAVFFEWCQIGFDLTKSERKHKDKNNAQQPVGILSRPVVGHRSSTEHRAVPAREGRGGGLKTALGLPPYSEWSPLFIFVPGSTGDCSGGLPGGSGSGMSLPECSRGRL